MATNAENDAYGIATSNASVTVLANDGATH